MELTEAEQLLKNLTEALDGAFISSWQSTHAWEYQLEAAQEYFYKKELWEPSKMSYNIVTPKTVEEFAKVYGKPADVVRQELFRYVDLLMEMDISEDVLDCGLYHNHLHNSSKNMVDSHRALLWAKYESLCGKRPEPYGPVINFVYTERF